MMVNSFQMKKLFSLFLVISLIVPASAQLATLIDAHGNVVNSGLIIHHGDNETPSQDVPVDVVLLGENDRTLNVRRYEIDVVPGTQNYFCWGVCYAPVEAGEMPFWQSENDHAIAMEPGVVASNFHAYHSPMGVLGNNVYRYVWFDRNSETDSVWVDIEFRVTPVGIREHEAITALNVFPNPVKDGRVTIDYQCTGECAGGQVIIRNAVGQVVHSETIDRLTGQLVLATDGYRSGIYFATVERMGQILATRRFSVAD